MRSGFRVAAASLVALLLPAAAAGQGGEVVVSAASSLADVLRRVGEAYEARAGERIALNTGPSNTLARQILAGAPVDVFISADEVQMDRVASRLLPGTRADLLGNRLAVAVPANRPEPIRGPADLLRASIRRVAVGDPAAVPAGVYARQYLERAGVWTAIQPRLLPMGSARLALTAVERGAVDAAIVYATDLRRTTRARAALIVPAAEGPRIVYPAAAIRGGPNAPGALRFLAFLRGEEAGALFADEGFERVHP